MSKQYKKTEHYKEDNRKRNGMLERKEEKRLYKRFLDQRKCLYNGETYTYRKLVYIFGKQGFEHPSTEALKCLINKDEHFTVESWLKEHPDPNLKTNCSTRNKIL